MEKILSVVDTLIPVPSDGDKGERGPSVRGPQRWAELEDGFAFGAGKDGDRYEDYVGHSDKWWYCKKSHAKSADKEPGTAGGDAYWGVGDMPKLIAAHLVLIEKEIVKNLIAENFLLTDGDGNVIVSMDADTKEVKITGDIYANNGYFSGAIFSRFTDVALLTDWGSNLSYDIDLTRDGNNFDFSNTNNYPPERTVNLPKASDYDGVHLYLSNLKYAASKSYYGPYTVNVGEKILQSEKKDSTTGVASYAQKFSVVPGAVASLVAIHSVLSESADGIIWHILNPDTVEFHYE